ncbi:hypothetical protein HV824_27790 [Myxococcus sp. AM009]|uniref:hypothetical protein n=1 Tax=unclassified Myxococcus TaxID=2648731 RepID=UPI0015956835|nr:MULTISPECIES: hypothetical protein [unclassified Myxococcus]NVJ01902.1 hypothetical protein [Myxococcus sp. AM009]NVJ13245.1 hypothetical protein [Myxococcus sp. AM010]
MKLPLMAAVAALAFWGCSSNSANTRADDRATGGSGTEATAPESVDTTSGWDDRSAGEAADVTENERRDRMDAPTVYDGEATGGSGPGMGAGTSVTTPEGEKYDVQDGPLLGGQPREETPEEGVGGSGKSDVEELDASDVETQEVELDEVEVDGSR